MFPELSYIYHKNKDPFDNRRKNIIDKTMVAKVNMLPTVNDNEWIGGKPSGSLCFMNNAWVVRFSDGTRSTFSKYNCKNIDDAKIQAKEFRIQQSLIKGLTKNQYRIVYSKTNSEYIEMKLQDDYIAKIDKEDLHIVEQFIYHAKKGAGCERFYMYQSDPDDTKKKILFHRVIFPEYKQIDHINRDGLDNRRNNLRSVLSAENNVNQKKRTDNKSGKTGIHYSKYDKCWVVQWPEDGKRKKKSFSESKYGYDGAKLMALNHRQKMDNKNGLMNGYESGDDIHRVIEPINIDKVQVKETLLSTNTSGKKGVYYMSKYKFWACEWKDEDGKKKSKRFYVGKKRDYDEAKTLAMNFDTNKSDLNC